MYQRVNSVSSELVPDMLNNNLNTNVAILKPMFCLKLRMVKKPDQHVSFIMAVK